MGRVTEKSFYLSVKKTLFKWIYSKTKVQDFTALETQKQRLNGSFNGRRKLRELDFYIFFLI